MQIKHSQEKASKPRYRSTINFFTGLMAGAAVSTLVPWEVLEQAAPGTRWACLAAIGAAFVVFRLAISGGAIRRATGVVLVSSGGLLMSAGASLTGAWAISPVSIGSVTFLCGVTLLMRERVLPSELKAEALEQVILDATRSDQPDTSLEGNTNNGDAVARIRALQVLEQSGSRQEPGVVPLALGSKRAS